MKKKIIMGLFVLAAVIGMGFAEETKSNEYYNGYNTATYDYSKDNDYNPSWCNTTYTDGTKKEISKKKYDCTQGYQDSWKAHSEAAPKPKTENTNN